MKIAIDTAFGRREGEMNQNIKLAPNFLLSELANTSGNAKEPMYLFSFKSDKHVEALQKFRDIVKEPVNVNSGFRQIDYNKKKGGDSNSAHLLGLATDIQPLRNLYGISTTEAWFSALAAVGINQGAINWYNGYYHLESYSQDLYGYNKPYTIRVYSNDEDYEQALEVFYYNYYNIIRVKK